MRTRLGLCILGLLLLTGPMAASLAEVSTPATPPTNPCAAKGAIPHLGCEAWAATYNGRDRQIPGSVYRDHAIGMAVPPGGQSVFVAGAQPRDGYWFDGFAVGYDGQTGSESWSFQVPGDPDAWLGGALASADGSTVYIGGRGSPTPGDWTGLLTARDASTGQELWTTWMSELVDASGASPESSYIHRIVLSPSEDVVYGVGEGYYPATGYDILVVAIDAAAGQVLWHRHLDDTPSRTESAGFIALGPAGEDLYIGGSLNGRGGYGMFTIRLDAGTGELDWLSQLRRGYSMEDLAVSPDGSQVFITGGPTRAIDADTGALLWTANQAPGQGLAVDPSGERVYVTFGEWWDFLDPADASRAVTIALDADTGERVWTDVYDPLPQVDNQSDDIALSPDGRCLYVTGHSDASAWLGVSDALTRILDPATGETLWAARYNGPEIRGDAGMMIEVASETGDVFVGGHTSGVETAREILVLKYDDPCDAIFSDD